MFAALLSAVLVVSQAEIVTDDVDLISVAHLPDDVRLVCFFGKLQGEPVQLDHRWAESDMVLVHSPEGVTLAWLDDSGEDPCYRIVRAPAYLESWEAESPLAGNHNKPWFVQLCEVGLKRPK